MASLNFETLTRFLVLFLTINNATMKRLTSLAFVILVVSCNTVPLTGRKQLNLLPGSQMLSLSNDQYSQVLNQSKVVKSSSDAQMVQAVGIKIKNAVERYLRENNQSDLIEGYNWEFNLIEDDQVNAWCMPGGKVAFYSGIMPVCQDENGVAVVMGHEVAHAIARHGNERMSQGLVQQFGGIALQVALSEKPAETQALYMQAYGIGSQVGVILPFSRTHESEADRLGLIFMAMAGYNPAGAPEFWKRMAALGGQAPPEFLSTHPSNQTRISNLNKWMPEALKYYKPKGN
jgi:predicted Zn-dependent protease